MSGSRAQERLEKLKANLKANVTNKHGDVPVKSAGTKNRKRIGDVRSQPYEKPKIPQDPEKPPPSGKRAIKGSAQMRLKKLSKIRASQSGANLGEGSKQSNEPSFATGPKVANLGGSADEEHAPKFKIPKKTAVVKSTHGTQSTTRGLTSLETSSTVDRKEGSGNQNSGGSTQYHNSFNRSRSLKAKRQELPNKVCNPQLIPKQKTLDAIVNPSEMASNSFQDRSSRENQSAQGSVRCKESTQPLAVQPKNMKVERNLFKRKAPGSVRPNAKTHSLQPQRNPSKSEYKDNLKNLSESMSVDYDRNKIARQSSDVQKPDGRHPSNSNHLKPESNSWRDMLSSVYKGVVNAVKETASYYSRSDVSKELQSVRRAVETVEAMDYEIISPPFEDEKIPLVQTEVYIVVDTCVVIDHLALVRSLKTRKIKGLFTPKVVVPWQVLKELDYLKVNRSKMNYVSRNARMAITYLMEEIGKYEFITGQPTAAALRALDGFEVEIPDDHIVKCCLQLKSNGHNVLLLTNDKNLVIKGAVNLIPSWRCEDFISSCADNNEPESLSAFETPPTGSFDPGQLPLANAAHQMAVLLKNFLLSVLKKFLMHRFQNLWVLRIPGNEPWCLTVLLETMVDYWAEMTAKYGAEADTKDVLLWLRRFIHKVAYDRLRYSEVDQFARCCHQLAVALPPSFGVEGVYFDNRLAFWKCPPDTDPPADVTFIQACVNLTIHHMQLFESNLVQYCFCASQSLGVPFSHAKLASCHPAVVDLNNLPKIFETVETMRKVLARINDIPVGSVVKSSDGASALWSSLVSSLGDGADNRFFVEDVVEFCNHPEIRHRFPEALQGLNSIASFLSAATRIAL